MKILITGGAGYIGSELVSHFIDEHKVTVYDNLLYNKSSLLRYMSHPNFTFVNKDVRDEKSLDTHTKDSDVIIPLAAVVGYPLCKRDPQTAWEVNYKANTSHLD